MVLEQSEVIIRLVASALLGSIVGFERELRGTGTGIRTLALVCLGSALFTAIAIMASESSGQNPGVITAGIITGIGFLGAGTILRTNIEVRGMTTAASVWLVSGIGMAVGYGYLYEATVVTIIAIVLLAVVRIIEVRLFDKDEKTGRIKRRNGS